MVSQTLNETKVSKAANTAISLLHTGSRTSDVAATFTSHAPRRRRQRVFELFAMDAVDSCKNRMEHEASGEDDESADEDPTESVTQTRTTLTTWKPLHVETQSVLQLHLEE